MIAISIMYAVSVVVCVIFFRWFIKQQNKVTVADLCLAVFMCILGPFGALLSIAMYLMIRVEKIVLWEGTKENDLDREPTS